MIVSFEPCIISLGNQAKITKQSKHKVRNVIHWGSKDRIEVLKLKQSGNTKGRSDKIQYREESIFFKEEAIWCCIWKVPAAVGVGITSTAHQH